MRLEKNQILYTHSEIKTMKLFQFLSLPITCIRYTYIFTITNLSEVGWFLTLRVLFYITCAIQWRGTYTFIYVGLFRYTMLCRLFFLGLEFNYQKYIPFIVFFFGVHFQLMYPYEGTNVQYKKRKLGWQSNVFFFQCGANNLICWSSAKIYSLICSFA